MAAMFLTSEQFFRRSVFPKISFSEDLIINAHRAPFHYTTEVCSCSATGIFELEHASQKNGIRVQHALFSVGRPIRRQYRIG
jgi:uncharacterized protein YqkB